MADVAVKPKRGNLTEGPIGKTLLAFALPTLASSIIQSLNGTINAIWVGRFIGETALAATSNANTWKKARMMAPPPADEEMLEEALGTREPGGALRPAG